MWELARGEFAYLPELDLGGSHWCLYAEARWSLCFSLLFLFSLTMGLGCFSWVYYLDFMGLDRVGLTGSVCTGFKLVGIYFYGAISEALFGSGSLGTQGRAGGGITWTTGTGWTGRLSMPGVLMAFGCFALLVGCLSGLGFMARGSPFVFAIAFWLEIYHRIPLCM